MSNPAVNLKLKNFKAAMRLPNMKDFGLMSAGQDLSWIANAASNTYSPTLTFVSTGVYSMHDPGSGALVAPSGGSDVYWNGVHLTPGLGYAIAGAYITFLTGYVPLPTDDIRVQFENAPAVSVSPLTSLHYVNLIGTKDGVNLNFILPVGSASFAAILRNGQVLDPGTDYVLSGVAVAFTVYPPQPTDILAALYLP